MSARPRLRMTEPEYLALDAAGDAAKYEYVNGEVVAMAGVSIAHDVVSVNVLVGLQTRLAGGPCRAHGADLRVHLDETGLYAYPDATVVCGPAELTRTRPPSLLNPRVVVEVLSESTEEYDRGAKLAHYQERASVDLVLLVDSRRRHVETFARNPDGTWTQSKQDDGDVTLACLGVRLPVSELYEGWAPEAE